MTPLTPDQIISQGSSVIGSNTGLWGWAALSGIALMTSAVILAVLYVWATLFRNPQLIAFIKQEIYELMITAALIPIIFGIVGSLHTLTIGTFVPPQLLPDSTHSTDTIYNVTGDYYAHVGNDIQQWLSIEYIVGMYVDQASSVQVTIRPVGVGLVSSPLAGFATPLKQLLFAMSTALSVALIVNEAQLRVFTFALQAFLAYYLPAGIFLRAFTPTRRLGGALIGIAMAFLVVLPVITVIASVVLYSPNGPMLNTGAVVSQFANQFLNPSYAAGGIVNSFFNNNFLGPNNFLSTATDIFLSPFSAFGSVLSGLFSSLFLTLLIIPVSTIAMAFTVAIVVPTFSILIFTQAARDFSKSFGEEIDISSLTRLI